MILKYDHKRIREDRDINKISLGNQKQQMKNEDLNVVHVFAIQSNSRTEEKEGKERYRENKVAITTLRDLGQQFAWAPSTLLCESWRERLWIGRALKRQQGKSRFLGPTSNTSLVYGMKEQSTGGDRAMCLWLESNVETPVDGAALNEGHGYENREYRTDRICCGIQST